MDNEGKVWDIGISKSRDWPKIDVLERIFWIFLSSDRIQHLYIYIICTYISVDITRHLAIFSKWWFIKFRTRDEWIERWLCLCELSFFFVFRQDLFGKTKHFQEFSPFVLGSEEICRDACHGKMASRIGKERSCNMDNITQWCSGSRGSYKGPSSGEVLGAPPAAASGFTSIVKSRFYDPQRLHLSIICSRHWGPEYV